MWKIRVSLKYGCNNDKDTKNVKLRKRGEAKWKGIYEIRVFVISNLRTYWKRFWTLPNFYESYF